MKQEIRERIEKIRKGEVPAGYRKTKVGIIPRDWEVKMLGEKTTKIGSGITPTGGEKVYKSEGRPFLRSQNVGWGNLILEEIAFIGDEIHNTFKATEIIKNDVFLNITGASIGRSAIADERVEMGNVNQHVCIIRTIENELNPKFLNYFLLSKNGQKQIDSYQAGGNRQGLNFGQIKSFQIPLPLIPEQQKIADILSTWDKAIKLKEKLITEKKEFKRGLMQRLLTGGTRFPEFTDEWEEKKIIDILNYEQPNKYITNNIVDTDETLTPVLTANKSFVLGSTFDKNGIYTETPVIIFDDFTIDNKYVDFRFKIKSSAIKILKTKNENNDIKFVYELMKFVKFPLGEHKRYYISEYQFVKIKMPKHIEQLKIVGVSNDLDSELKILNKELNQLKEQKRGLTQLLLTGIVRVEVN